MVKRQRWSQEHKARGQGQKHQRNSRLRTALSRTDPLEANDKNARGQGPRTQHECDFKKKSLLQNLVNFAEISSVLQKKKMFSKFFPQALWRSSRRHKIGHDLGAFLTSQNILLFSSRRQGIFEAKAKNLT